MNNWSELKYWSSPEWKTVEERLDALDAAKLPYNPGRRDLFSALDAVPLHKVTAVILGQDPYPDQRYATGIAFAVPDHILPAESPASLRTVFREYCADLHYSFPETCGLTPWIKQGVLLWNVYPSCVTGQPGSHHWDEWYTLTREIVETLDARGNIVFTLLGQHARSLSRYIVGSKVIETSHPSPLGARKGFLGSRIFTTINTKLHELNQTPIEWRLP